VRLLIVRHAIAVERGTPGIPDDERRLTKEGVRRFRRAAAGVVRILPRPDLLLTSPLPRARETAEILAKAWGHSKPRASSTLVGGSLEEVAKVVGNVRAGALVVIVGHEPHVSAWLARLVGGDHSERTTFRKGGCALVECPGALHEGGSLVFFLPPRILRRLA
jgi:phosphohistidine phosphatase